MTTDLCGQDFGPSCRWFCARATGLALGLVSLSACETSEMTTARQSQFNGKPLEEVVAVIGPPTRRSRSQAVWSFRETYTFHSPNYVAINNQLIMTGTTSHEGVRACTFRAELEAGMVIGSSYEGNGCARYAPKPDRQR